MTANYFEPGGDTGVCTKCGLRGMLRPFPGSPRDRLCQPCRRRDGWFFGILFTLLFVGVPVAGMVGAVLS